MQNYLPVYAYVYKFLLLHNIIINIDGMEILLVGKVVERRSC
jgi:hypothetical protein